MNLHATQRTESRSPEPIAEQVAKGAAARLWITDNAEVHQRVRVSDGCVSVFAASGDRTKPLASVVVSDGDDITETVLRLCRASYDAGTNRARESASGVMRALTATTLPMLHALAAEAYLSANHADDERILVAAERLEDEAAAYLPRNVSATFYPSVKVVGGDTEAIEVAVAFSIRRGVYAEAMDDFIAGGRAALRFTLPAVNAAIALRETEPSGAPLTL